MTDTVLYETAGTVAVIRLNRPGSMNALTAEMKTGLLAARRADPVRAVLVTGNGPGFCAGQDLVEHADLLESGARALNTVREHYNPIVTEIMTHDGVRPQGAAPLHRPPGLATDPRH